MVAAKPRELSHRREQQSLATRVSRAIAADACDVAECGRILHIDPKSYRYRSGRPGHAQLEKRIKETLPNPSASVSMRRSRCATSLMLCIRPRYQASA